MARIVWLVGALGLVACGGDKDEERCACDECEEAVVECEANYPDGSKEEEDCEEAALLLCDIDA